MLLATGTLLARRASIKIRLVPDSDRLAWLWRVRDGPRRLRGGGSIKDNSFGSAVINQAV
jgi:hypothetical protein